MAFAFAGQWGPEPVVDRFGNAVYSATFRVLTTSGAEATVYTDRTKDTTTPQPLDVDGEGNATFYAAPGRYTIELTAGGSVTSFPVGVVPDGEDVESIVRVKARTHLVTPGATATENRTLLQAAVDDAATEDAPLTVRGDFPITGGAIAPVSAVEIDARESTITQQDNLTPVWALPARSILRGGHVVGKGTDWVDNSTVYPACAVRLDGDHIRVIGLRGTNLAGAGVYSASARTGLRVLDCEFDGTSQAAGSQYGAGVVLNDNLHTDVVVAGGAFAAWAQGVTAGKLDDFFIGGGLRLNTSGQHGIYLGSVLSGAIDGVRINGTGREAVKAQVSDASAFDGDLCTIANVVGTAIGSHGIHLANTQGTPSNKTRRTVVHDCIISHAAQGNGEDVRLEHVNGVTVHDVIGYLGNIGLLAKDSSDVLAHHNRFESLSRSGIVFTDVTDSALDGNRVIDAGKLADVNSRFGILTQGSTTANIRFANNRITDALSNMEFCVYIAGGDLTTMEFLNNKGSGATGRGFRSATTTNTNLWVGNDLQGAGGRFFNIPTNAGAIADTSGATLAALEAEVNKLKARLRTSYQIN